MTKKARDLRERECGIDKMLIMKRILILFTALAALVAFASCEKPQPDGPDVPAEVTVTFPELVENYEVKPGESLTVTFTPAKDWTISVPSDNIQWFWIADGSFKLADLSGKASSEAVTVTIGVSETEEFETNRSCDVTLAIGDESKVIAKYMRPAKERSLSVYAAELSETGGFKLAEDGVSYVYGSEAATSVALVWSASDADFRAPVRVDSNGEWTVTYPEWLTVNVPEKTAGVVELVITGESLEAATGKIAFYAGEKLIKEIEVSIPSCKGVEVYSASVEEGEFEYDEDGEYLWSSESVSEITLAWLGADFRMPVKISSKCNWTLEMPEWLTAELPLETAGEVSLTLMGVPSKYPLENTSDKVVFKSGETVIHEVTINIPGCKDIMKYTIDMALTELDFNAVGEVMTTTGYADVDVTATLFGTSQTSVHAFEISGGKYIIDKAPEWLNVTVAAFRTENDANVLQDRKVTVTVSENTGEERSAILFFAPHSLSGKISDAFNEGKTAVKEEYLKYVVQVRQISNKFVIDMNSTEDAMATAGASFEPASDEKRDELTEAFGETDQVYVLTYDNIYALDEARMSMSRAFASVKVFDSAKTDQSAVEDFWLAFSHEEGMNAGVVEMYFDSDPSALPPLPNEPSTGYVVFYDESDSVLAIIECISPYEEAYFSISTQTLTFAPEASELELEISTNLKWSIESNADWCTVSPLSGQTDCVVKVSVEENESDTERVAILSIVTSNSTTTVSVTQKCGEVLEIAKNELEFDFNSSTKSILVTSNVDWTIESNVDWCEVSPSSGNGTKNVSITVGRNKSAQSRTAVLTLSSSTLTKTIHITQTYDDGSTTNGDDIVHFVDFASARAAGATLERLTSGKLYKEYRDGNVPVYHLTYTKESTPLRITLPENIIKHNVNPYGNIRNIRVNDTVYEEYFGPNDILGEVVLDDDNSVAIYMSLPSGKDYMRGNINFTASDDTLSVILICTLDISAE